MKQLLIYIGSEPKFSEEHETLTKIQIDNSLEWWKPEDILLVTDFSYEYKGVKSYVVSGNFKALDGNRSSKIPVINQLFRDGIINDLFWFHDHDAFQLGPMRDPELGDYVAGFTTEGWSDRWNAGSFFFTSGAEKIFKWIERSMLQRNTNEQDALTHLWSKGLEGYKILNNTYNVGIYHTEEVLKKVDTPLIVAHFHPRKPKHMEIFKDLIPEKLRRIFEINEKIADLKSLVFDAKGRYREWAPYFNKYHCDVVCEIGIRQGFHFDYLIKSNPKQAVAVDCWIDDGVIGRNDSCFNQAGLDRQYEKFKNLMADKPFVKICKGYSFDVVKEFSDEYFDYIFIDGDHTYPGISRDLVDWYPKMKKGGVFCGHDYNIRNVRAKNGVKIEFGVIKAVDEFVAKNNITTFFTLTPNTWGIIK